MRGRRIDPLYVVSAALFVITIVVLAVTAGGATSSDTRSGSVYDTGRGGAAAFRHYVEALGASTRTVEGDAFDPGMRA